VRRSSGIWAAFWHLTGVSHPGRQRETPPVVPVIRLKLGGMITVKFCIFCEIGAGRAQADVVREWPDTIAIRAEPGVSADGHVLVIPRVHVVTAIDDHTIAGLVASRAAQLAVELGWDDLNMIDNVGRAASQTVMHYHRHIVRRRFGDGLLLPWPQSAAGPASS
jgi:histidine triad (HIT) family protein